MQDGEGTYFAVWAPNTEHVFIMGEFNGWDKTTLPLSSRRGSQPAKDLCGPPRWRCLQIDKLQSRTRGKLYLYA